MEDTAEDADPHVRMYGKKFYEVKYLDARCPVCGNRIDEFGYCSCGSGDS